MRSRIFGAPLLGGAAIPHQVFFNPTPEFIKWLRTEFQGPMVDMGAGTGLLVKEVGPEIMTGIDIMVRDHYEAKVQIADATEFDYTKYKTATITRASPGDWIEIAITKACRDGCKVVYVGKAKRAVGDLHYVRKNRHMKTTKCTKDFKIVADNGEKCVVYVIEPLTAKVAQP